MSLKHSIPVFFVLILLIVSCGQQKNKVVGVWKVKEVEVDADTITAKSEALKTSKQRQQSLRLELFEDKTMNIISMDNTFPGTWSFDEASGNIYVRLEGAAVDDSLQIGQYEDEMIIKREKKPFGWMVTYFEKE